MEQERQSGLPGPEFDLPNSTSGERPHQRMFRSKNDRVVAGVCGGLGQYFGIDPVLFRIAFVALALAGGAGILIYIVAAIILPEARPDEEHAFEGAAASSQGKLIVGGLFIVLGAYLLMREILPWYSERIVWGLILVAIGLIVVLRGTNR